MTVEQHRRMLLETCPTDDACKNSKHGRLYCPVAGTTLARHGSSSVWVGFVRAGFRYDG